ncbi:sulfatase family protein [Reichenbachiella versicolor]|uniref:sulfatase family protein n=1 Tax=Reichenbachiella versicolor TaxID=1821036 RepID=UPI000D6E8910|nr:arylsulfatase [Reichenbachiella versicolor]
MRRRVLVLIGIFCWVSTMAEKPNVLVILADDIGLGDISYYRSKHSQNLIVQTPTIDKIAQEGMAFTNAHSPAGLCAPSRYAIMTGNNTYRSYKPWGVWGSYQRSPIEKEDITLGQLMKSVGYQTAFFGKWHIGGDFKRKSNPNEVYRSNNRKREVDVDISQYVGGGPSFQGFDYDFTYPAGIQDAPYAVFENGKWYPLDKNSKIEFLSYLEAEKKGLILDKEEGLADTEWDSRKMGPLLAKKAVDYIHSHSQKKEPFFIYYSSEAVHRPHTPPVSINGKKIKGSTPSPHLDMVKELDQQVAMLIDALKENGVYDNTLIIFTSDNGGLKVKESIRAGHNSSDIYRGSKNSTFEGGHRVPFIVSWPKMIESGITSSEAIQGNDIMATLAALHNTSIPSHQALDSYNFLPILINEKEAKGRDFMVLQGGSDKRGTLIENGWKLIVQFDKKDKSDQTRTPLMLFNLNEDVKEKNNLIDQPEQQERIKSMFAKFNQYRDSKKRSTAPIKF